LRLVAKNVFIYPHSDFPLLKQNHVISRPKIPKNFCQNNESLKDPNQLLIGITQITRVELFKEISAKSWSLKQKPSMARVYHLNYRNICSHDAISRDVGLFETRRRTEERFSEAKFFQFFEFEEICVILVWLCFCMTFHGTRIVAIILL